MKVLFICTANLCRSAAAEKLLRHYGAGAGFEARSRGTAAAPGAGMPSAVRDFLSAAGVQDLGHRPELVMEADIGWADLVLVMEDHHYEAVAERFPQAMRKMHLFLDFCAGAGEAGLEDPAGKSRAVFDRVLSAVDAAVKALVARKGLPA